MKEEELELIKFNNFIDELEDVCGLTLFQIAFIKEVKYFNHIQGSFKFFKSHYIKKYKEVINEKQMMIELDELELLGLIKKDIKRTIYNGKYVTIIIYNTSLNPEIGFWSRCQIIELINSLDVFKYEIKKLDNNNKRLIAIDIYMIEKEIKNLNKQMQISTQEKIDAILLTHHNKILNDAIKLKNYKEVSRINNILK